MKITEKQICEDQIVTFKQSHILLYQGLLFLTRSTCVIVDARSHTCKSHDFMLTARRPSLSYTFVKIIDLFRLFPRFLTSNVTIRCFLLVMFRMKVRQNYMILQGQMITYTNQWKVIFTLFLSKIDLNLFIIANLSQRSMRTSRINRCEPCYAGTKFPNRVVVATLGSV